MSLFLQKICSMLVDSTDDDLLTLLIVYLSDLLDYFHSDTVASQRQPLGRIGKRTSCCGLVTQFCTCRDDPIPQTKRDRVMHKWDNHVDQFMDICRCNSRAQKQQHHSNHRFESSLVTDQYQCHRQCQDTLSNKSQIMLISYSLLISVPPFLLCSFFDLFFFSRTILLLTILDPLLFFFLLQSFCSMANVFILLLPSTAPILSVPKQIHQNTPYLYPVASSSQDLSQNHSLQGGPFPLAWVIALPPRPCPRPSPAPPPCRPA